MLRRLGSHIRNQWIGVIALFLVLTGGVAYAANEWTGDNIVDGSLTGVDLENNSVRSPDVQDVRSQDVRDDTLANGGLAAEDLQPDSVGTSEVADGAVDEADLAGSARNAFVSAEAAHVVDAVRINDTTPGDNGETFVKLFSSDGMEVYGSCRDDALNTGADMARVTLFFFNSGSFSAASNSGVASMPSTPSGTIAAVDSASGDQNKLAGGDFVAVKDENGRVLTGHFSAEVNDVTPGSPNADCVFAGAAAG